MPVTARTISFNAPYEAQWSGVTSLREASLWLLTALRKIAELAKLQENWDSYGSRPIQGAAIERTIELLRELSKFDLPLPQIFPVPGGGIQLEWQNAKCELEIEVRSDGSVEFLIVDEEGKMREGPITPDTLTEIYRLAHWFKREQSSVVYL
ncbi:MAG: hypothetical protein ACREBD_11345 [Blastocatellia bacterium]